MRRFIGHRPVACPAVPLMIGMVILVAISVATGADGSWRCPAELARRFQRLCDAAGLRRGNLLRCLHRGRMIHFREPSFFGHVLLGLLPFGDFRGLLGPVHYCGFIAPVEQLGHGLAMRTTGAVGVHRGLILPGGHRPKNEASIDQQPAAEKTGAVLDLTYGLQCVPEKSWQKEEGADSQARDGN
jgi:hypothetical protein